MENNKEQTQEGKLELILSWSERRFSGEEFTPGIHVISLDGSYRLHRNSNDCSKYQSELPKLDHKLLSKCDLEFELRFPTYQKSARIQIHENLLINGVRFASSENTANSTPVSVEYLGRCVSEGSMNISEVDAPLQGSLQKLAREYTKKAEEDARMIYMGFVRSVW